MLGGGAAAPLERDGILGALGGGRRHALMRGGRGVVTRSGCCASVLGERPRCFALFVRLVLTSILFNGVNNIKHNNATRRYGAAACMRVHVRMRASVYDVGVTRLCLAEVVCGCWRVLGADNVRGSQWVASPSPSKILPPPLFRQKD